MVTYRLLAGIYPVLGSCGKAKSAGKLSCKLEPGFPVSSPCINILTPNALLSKGSILVTLGVVLPNCLSDF